MKIYTFYTDNNERLLREWFLPTLKDNYPVIAKKGDQGSADGVYKENGWFYLVSQKIDLVIQAIRENWNECFIYSDPDIQFFGPISQRLSEIYKKEDLLFQRESAVVFCTGFFLCAGNAKTLNFWQDVKDIIGQNDMDDQDAANYLLKNKLAAKFICKFLNKLHRNKWQEWLWKFAVNSYGIKWDYLPDEFYNVGILTRKHWSPGMHLPIPENIVLHHANWTKGIENKISQLEYVRDMVRNQKIRMPLMNAEDK